MQLPIWLIGPCSVWFCSINFLLNHLLFNWPFVQLELFNLHTVQCGFVAVTWNPFSIYLLFSKCLCWIWLSVHSVCFIRDTVKLRHVLSLKFSEILTWLVPYLSLIFTYYFSVQDIHFAKYSWDTIILRHHCSVAFWITSCCPLFFSVQHDPVP